MDGKHKLTDLHHRVLHDIAHQSDLLFLKIQRNTTKSLMVELWFQRVWTLLKTFNFLIPEERNRELQYHETAVAHLHALEFSRRIWISLWELSPGASIKATLIYKSRTFVSHNSINVFLL